MKKTVWIFMAAFLATAGCDSTPAQRIETIKNTLTTAQKISAGYDSTSQILRTSLAQANAMLADPNLQSDQKVIILETIARIQDKMAMIEPQKADIDKKIGEMQTLIKTIESGGEVDMAKELQFYSHVIGAASPYFGSFAMWAQLAAILLAAIAGIIARKKTGAASKIEATMVDIVSSVSVLLDAIENKKIASTDDAKNLLKGAQDSSTRLAVNRIKAELKEPMVT